MSDLHERNRRAIEQGFQEMNDRLGQMNERLDNAYAAISRLQADLIQVKQQSVEDMVKKFGSGPTAN